MLGKVAGPAPSPATSPFNPYDRYDYEKVHREQVEELLAMGVERERAEAAGPLDEDEELELLMLRSSNSVHIGA